MSIEEVRVKSPQIAKIFELLDEMDRKKEAEEKLWITFPKDSFEYRITKKSVDTQRSRTMFRMKMSFIRAFTIFCWLIVAFGAATFIYIVYLAFYGMMH